MNRRGFLAALMAALPATAAVAVGARSVSAGTVPKKIWWDEDDFIKWDKTTTAPITWGAIDPAQIEWIDCRIDPKKS